MFRYKTYGNGLMTNNRIPQPRVVSTRAAKRPSVQKQKPLRAQTNVPPNLIFNPSKGAENNGGKA